MSKAPAIGIKANSINHPAGYKNPRFDKRRTSEVDTTRAPNNGKPFRNKQQKEIARSEAFVQAKGKSKGTHVSYAYRLERDVLKPEFKKKSSKEDISPELAEKAFKIGADAGFQKTGVFVG